MPISKECLAPGHYKSPDGEVDVTAERNAHFVSQFQRMKEAGLRVPVPWGHQPQALPSPEDAELWATKYNAGFVHEMAVDENGQLVVAMEIPLDDDRKRVGTTVKEVSPLIHKKWRDGKGVEWDDVITHVALVTHPVEPSQKNFTPDAGAMRLALSYHMQGEMPNGTDTEEKAEGEDAVEAEEETEVMPSGATVDTAKELLGMMTPPIVLPDDTNRENFLDRLVAVLGALIASKPAEPEETPKEPEVVEETPPADLASMRLSLKGVTNELEGRCRELYASRLDKLVQRGAITPALHKELQAKVTSYRLSLTDGKRQRTELDVLLEAYEKLPDGCVWSPDEKVQRLGIMEVPGDKRWFAGTSEPDDERAREIVEQQFKHAGIA